MNGPLLPKHPATFARILNIIDVAFGNAMDELDTLAAENALMSDEMMSLVNQASTDFAAAYAERIQDGWDWDNAEVVDG